MNPRNLCIYGAGGHGLVVAEAAELAGYNVLGYYDDNPNAALPMGQRIDPATASPTHAQWFVGIGSSKLRAEKTRHLHSLQHTLANIIHPHASVSPRATLATGIYVGPQAVVGPGSTLEAGVIVNSAAVVEHHVQIGEFAHIAPNATVGGAARIGPHALIGIGAAVLPVITVGEHATLGAGAVATHNQSPHITSVGIPARRWV